MGDGQAGLGHPPWRGGGVKGSERCGAGCAGEFLDPPRVLGFRLWGLGFRNLDFRVLGLGFGSLGFRV